MLGITSCTRVAASDSSRSTAASIVIVGDMTRRRNIGKRRVFNTLLEVGILLLTVCSINAYTVRFRAITKQTNHIFSSGRMRRNRSRRLDRCFNLGLITDLHDTLIWKGAHMCGVTNGTGIATSRRSSSPATAIVCRCMTSL